MKTIEQEKMMTLPIFKHFENTDLMATGKNTLDKFKKGEWTIFTVLRVAIVAAVGYLSWVYVLPPIFQAAGQLLAVASTLVLSVLLLLLAPVIFKGLRRLTRSIHKGVIRNRPFEELEDQRNKMLDNQQKFRVAKGKIRQLKDDMETEAAENETNAKKLEDKIIKSRAKAERLKNDMQEMEKTGGKGARSSDEYVQKNAELMKTLSDAQRDANMREQAKTFVGKYGTRFLIMKKLDQKLYMVDTAMDIKIQDFDATVEILKKDFEFAKKSREATETAKSAMHFTKSWELEYALDVVTNTIAEDIAITTGNLNDIDKLTANFSIDNDEMFANLDKLTNDIKIGANAIPDADKYNNPDYVLTGEDRRNSGAFGQIF